MLSNLKYINDNCQQGCLLGNSKLLFQFERFDLLIEYNSRNEKDIITPETVGTEFSGLLSNNDIDLLGNIELISQFICISEALEMRNRTDKPESIRSTIYSINGKLNAVYPNSIAKLRCYTSYGFSNAKNYISLLPNYVGELEISNAKFADQSFYSYLFSNINEIFSFVLMLPQYYEDYKLNHRYLRNRRINILMTQTKARRLGYITVLSDFLIENPRLPKSRLNKRFEAYATHYQAELNAHISNKGVVKVTTTGNSSKPYIDLAQSLQLLNIVHETVSRAKHFKVFSVVRGRLSFDAANKVFELTRFEKAFYLDLLISNDYFYLNSIIELIFIGQSMTYSDFISNFQAYILSKLKNISDDFVGSRENIHVKELIRRINKWEEVEVYLEHVLMPRLNWLQDLALVNRINTEYSLTDSGVILFRNLCCWSDIDVSEYVDSKSFLRSYGIHLYASVYEHDHSPNSQSEEQILEVIDEYIKESFLHFKTLAPNRITASQAIDFVKYMAYFERGVKLGYNYIEELLKNNKMKNFVARFQSSTDDGYIQIAR